MQDIDGVLFKPLIGFQSALHIEFAVGVGLVHLDGFGADSEHFGNFFVGLAFGDKHHNFLFACGQGVEMRAVAILPGSGFVGLYFAKTYFPCRYEKD